MSFNLLTSPWIEVRRAKGETLFITPAQITDGFQDNPIVALHFPRADWNAAVTEFLIGMMYVALPPQDTGAWSQKVKTPPTPAELEQAMKKDISSFDFDGQGPRAFQDFDPLDKEDIRPVSGLLIDAPGENTAKNNSDLFVKRDGIVALCLPYAAAALITLQTYSPAGGVGYRTSLRGGGPLTTLVAPRRQNRTDTTLWDLVWANVPQAVKEKAAFKITQVFPWLAPTLTSEKDQIVSEVNSPSALAFFACPRRVRLVFADEAICSLSHRTGPAVIGFRAKNYGACYQMWQHPLSPYRKDKESGLLPLHPHAGASDYGDWLAWWGMEGKPATCQELWETRQKSVRSLLDPSVSMMAFGFDMDNMKARQWLQSTIPWIPISNQTRGELQAAVSQLVEAAHQAARAVQYQAKVALFAQKNKDGAYLLPDNLPKDALAYAGDRLWSESEASFRSALDAILKRLESSDDPTTDLNVTWLNTLRALALKIFEETVDTNGLLSNATERLTLARHNLALAFSSHPKAAVTAALNLTQHPLKTKKAKKGASA